MEEERTRVFVYGTLKKHFHNHRVLGDSRLIGEGRTMKPYKLVVQHGYAYPFLLEREEKGKREGEEELEEGRGNKGMAVYGEIYEVSKETLERLDWLEGHPRWYRRSLISVLSFPSAQPLLCHSYLKTEPTPQLLLLPSLSEFLNASVQFYFAFGSNMNIKRMESRGCPFYNRRPAFLEGWKLVFNKISVITGAGFANVVPAPGHTVFGVLYQLPESSLETLDGFEGVAAGEYKRTILPVQFLDYERLGMANVYVSEDTMEGLLPTKEYLHHLQQAEGLPQEYMSCLLNQKTLD